MVRKWGSKLIHAASVAVLTMAPLCGAPKNVFAPLVVGRPPSDSYIGLTRLPTGEIRHYNYGEWPDSETPGYIVSIDDGFTWQRKELPNGAMAADQRSPISGEYIRLFNAAPRAADGLHRHGASWGPISVLKSGVYVARSKGGIDGQYDVRWIWPESAGMLKPPVYIRGGKRILVATGFRRRDGIPGNCSGVFYSDDDGLTWKLSSLVTAPPHQAGGIHKAVRWQNGAVEPTVVELKDGRIWMLMRTSQDNLYESFSRDGGQTWEESRPSRFYSTITMPTVGRLKDGRILLLWNNTTPLPEVARDQSHRFFLDAGVFDGTFEDVFDNRDAIHAAVSADEGRTWQGFRELLLDERRNDRDYGWTGGTDRSVHQSQFVELDNGAILAAVGQHPMHRSLVTFSPNWLLEKTRSNSFENGLNDWSIHMFLTGIRGHCSFNRKTGAKLVEHPNDSHKKALQVCRPNDRTLVSENQGAVWNFPAGHAGTFTTRVMFLKGGQGGRISLLDRWVNPTDWAVDAYSMFDFHVRGDGAADGDIKLTPDRWHTLRFEWDGLNKQGGDRSKVYVDGVLQKAQLPLNRPSVNGISYVHFQSTASTEDTSGFMVESVAAEVQ